MHRIVIQLDSRANFDVRICFAKASNLCEIDAGMIAVVIGQGDVGQATFTRGGDPRLKQRLAVGLQTMPLWVRMIIGKKAHREIMAPSGIFVARPAPDTAERKLQRYKLCSASGRALRSSRNIPAVPED